MIASIAGHVNRNARTMPFMKAVQCGHLVRINMKIQLHPEASKVISGNRIFISSFRINVPNARHFMMNLNVQQFAL
jgi:hypothetical protein